MWWRPSRMTPSSAAEELCAVMVGRDFKRSLRPCPPLPPSVTSTISGGMLMRTGSAVQPRPPETTTSHFVARVAIGEARAVARRHDRRPAQQPHLTAMGMSGQLQRHPIRNAHGHVGFMRHQDDRRIVGHFLQRRGEIVDADARQLAKTPSRKISELIAKPCQPERPACLRQPHDVVFVNRYAGGFELAAGFRYAAPVPLHRPVVPPVVIAEHRMHAERRFQSAQHRRPLRRARCIPTPAACRSHSRRAARSDQRRANSYARRSRRSARDPSTARRRAGRRARRSSAGNPPAIAAAADRSA